MVTRFTVALRMVYSSTMTDEDSYRILTELATTKMPFGKYSGYYLVDLPEAYVLWFREKGFPKGRLGELLANLEEIKINGLEPLVRKIRDDLLYNN